MTFPIRKRINAEVFIGRKQGLNIQKWLVECSGKIEDNKMYRREIKGGYENRKL